MKSNEIRRTFIDFFASKEHTFVKSAPIFPKDDPSLLFTNAGMNQFKDIFLGVANERNLKRAANSQKCMRVSGKHNDLEEVGRDHHHHTFFEMLGNWSFGDYYKKEAISWAWELLTKVWKLPKNKLFVTVHPDDQDAESFWQSETDVDKSQISKSTENFWEMGETGPCGTCSEIHIDRGEGHCVNENNSQHSCGVGISGCGRYVELWNLVFMQSNREKDGTLKELPNKNIDTGMGLERIAAVLQSKRSNYDTDLFSPIIQRVEKLSGKTYCHDDNGMPFRVIADHIRALSFAIADGVLPSNEGRGYVMRRLLRRAVRYGRKLGFTSPFLNKLVPVVVDMAGSAYHELVERADFIVKIVETEEKSFEKTLDKGLDLFDSAAKNAKSNGKGVIEGSTVFKLYDTYGFPVDLTLQLAQENGLSIDEKGFEAEMKIQKERARSASKFRDMESASAMWVNVSTGTSSNFTGYTSLSETVEIRKVRKTAHGYDLVLDKTPFYAESGGQCGDTGLINLGESGTIEVINTIKEGSDTVHVCNAESEIDFSAIKMVSAEVNSGRRADIRRNHTATHILQYALRRILGDHVKQSGSMNNNDRLRFDFTHFQTVTDEELTNAERIANELVLKNLPVNTTLSSMKEAEEKGALALFGEKYGESVRVVSVGDESVELCGGTHVPFTGEIGYIHILFETSVSAGIRRIEAITGRAFGEIFRTQQPILKTLCRTFKVPVEKLPEQIGAQSERIRNIEKECSTLKGKLALVNIGELIEASTTINNIKVVREFITECDRQSLETKAGAIIARIGTGVALLFAGSDNKGVIFAAVSQDLIKEKKLNAGNIVKSLSTTAGGKGGGRPDMAQGGAKDIASLRPVYDQLDKHLEALLK